ncbi:MAG: oxidoreductase [Deltaproteobacteria bacterium]|nr:oxidoreductase [Deltaproteobacteria bacterium]
MKTTDSILFPRSGTIAKNRTLLAAMTNKQSHENGILSEDEIAWLVRRGKGGFGITTTAAAHVTKTGKGWSGEMGVWGDHHMDGLSNMASRLHETGTLGLVQLFHGGMRAPVSLNKVQPISASTNTEPHMDGVYTRAMTSAQIEEMIQSFTQAAIRCQNAGFDGVELHGAHSYLISQFLGTKTNRREDEWGGDIKGRSRFLTQIIASVRKAVGDQFLLSVRISPVIESIGIALEDSLELARMLSSTELDMLHVSCWDVFQEVGDGNNTSLTKRFRQVVPKEIPIISTGGIWSAQDAQWLMSEGADIVGVARVAIGHPDWPQGLEDEDYTPSRPPFSVEHLQNASLSPTFVEYMKRWKNFVIS